MLPVRIAMISRNGRGQTGSVNKILDHARRFTAHGWQVTIAANRIDAKALQNQQIGAQRIRESWLPWRKPRLVFRQKAERWAAQQRFDLVIAHGDVLVQDVLHVHNCVHLAHEILKGRPPDADHDVAVCHHALLTGQRFHALIANSRLMRDDLCHRFAIPSECVHVIHPGFDPTRFRREDRERLGPPIRARLGIPSDRLLLGFITSGNFHKRGLDLLIQAIAGLPESLRRSFHVAVLGSDRHADRYLTEATAAGIRNLFTIVGKQTAIEAWHHAMDLFVLPARIEEFGQAAQEAMVCGVPAIVTDRMGISERLPPSERHGVIPAGQVEPLREALRRFLQEPALRARWAETCLQACRHNTWAHNWQTHVPIYEQTMAAKAALGHS